MPGNDKIKRVSKTDKEQKTSYVRVTFERDLQTAKEILSKTAYVLYLSKSKLVLEALTRQFNGQRLSLPDNQGYLIFGEGADKEMNEHHDKLNNFLNGMNFTDAKMKTLVGSRELQGFKKAFSKKRYEAFKKLTKDMTVLSRLNQIGIMVTNQKVTEKEYEKEVRFL